MPPKRKASVLTTKAATAASLANDTDHDEDTLFEETFEINTFMMSDSEDSDWGKPNRKTRKRVSKPSRTTKAPALSDNEWMTDGELEADSDWEADGGTGGTKQELAKRSSGAVLSKSNTSAFPDTVQIKLNLDPAGPGIINLNLADILNHLQSKDKGLDQGLIAHDIQIQRSVIDEDTTLVECTPERDTVTKAITLQGKRNAKACQKTTKTKTGFLDLPAELRTRIYPDIFVEQKPDYTGAQKAICFIHNEDTYSAQFLRTCRLVYEEGRPFLYGDNRFEFRRNQASRGQFWRKQWKEIGYKDVRRFLETIGPVNMSYINNISFILSDATPSTTPYLTTAERRFVNDATLHHIFEMIGRTTVLQELRVTCDARRFISLLDYHFLRYVTMIKCHSLVCDPQTNWHSPKIGADIMEKMEKMMIVKKEEGSCKS